MLASRVPLTLRFIPISSFLVSLPLRRQCFSCVRCHSFSLPPLVPARRTIAKMVAIAMPTLGNGLERALICASFLHCFAHHARAEAAANPRVPESCPGALL